MSDVQLVSATEVAYGKAFQAGVLYQLNVPPYTLYNWDGAALSPVWKGSGVAGVKNYVGTRILNTLATFGFGQGGNAFTWALQVAVPNDFVAVRPVLMNGLSSAITGVTVAASAGGAASDRLNSAGAWTAATFGGAASGTLPAAPSTADPTITVPDWIPLQSVPRSDGGALRLIYLRVMTPAANAQAPANGPGVDMTPWATKADGLVWAWRYQQGDFVAAPGSMNSNTDPGGAPIVGVQYLAKNGAITSAVGFGDSILSGKNATINVNGWLNRAGVAAGVVTANCGVEGYTMAQCLTRAQRYIPALRPSVAFFPMWSPNEGTPSAALTARAKAYVMQFVDICRQYNTIPVIFSSTPVTTDATNAASLYTSTQDDYRKQLQIDLAAIGVRVCDISPVISDTNALGTASKWVSAAATSDGLHPSDACYGLMAGPAAPLLASLA